MRAALLVLMLVVSACRPEGGNNDAHVDVDAGSQNAEISLSAYLPNDVRVHPGDTVVFKSRFSGEPHTVTLGRLVDAGVSANAERIFSGLLDEAPQLKEIPALSPLDFAGRTSRVSLPCFLRRGPAREIRSCSRRQPEFDGRLSFFSSGVLSPGETFPVKLSQTITPGAYAFFCLVHRAKMLGQISVVGPEARPASAERLRFRAAEQRQSARNALKAAVQQLGRPQPDAALAGVSLPQLPNSTANVFLPPKASITAGGAVTWNVFGSHVIAFNPPRTARRLVAHRSPFRLNPRATAPAGGPPAPRRPPVRLTPGTEQPVPTLVDGGSWDGRGFRSSGILFSFSPALLAYKLTFTNPGTYGYQCLVRPTMSGTVVVQ